MASNLIGALRVTLGIDTAAFSQGMSKAQRDAAKSSAAIQKSLGGIQRSMNNFSAGLTVAAFGVVAKRALEYASSLGEIAQQLNVTTKDLQVFRYAASQVGVSQEEMDKGLAKLTAQMGKAQVGSKQAAAAFGAIGISVDQLKGKDAGAVIRLVADGLSKVKDPAQRAAVEIALFGKAGQKLDTLLSGGSKAIAELASAAEKLGIILSDDQIQNADNTADKLESLKKVLEARIAGVVTQNSDSILQLANSLSQLAGSVTQFLASDPARAYGLMGALAGSRLGWAGAALGGVTGYSYGSNQRGALADQNMDVKFRAQQAKAAAQALRNAVPDANGNTLFRVRNGPAVSEAKAEADKQSKLLAQAVAAGRAQRAAAGNKPTGEVGDFLAPAGPKGKSAEQLENEAQRQREKVLREQYRADSDALRGQLDLTDAQAALTYDVRERGKLAEERLALERQGEELEAKYQLASGDITKAQYDAKVALIDRVAVLRMQKQTSDEEYDVQRAMLERHRDIAESAIEQQEMEASLAETAAERREIELRIIAAKFALLRQAQQDVIDDDRASIEQKDAAQREMSRLDRKEGFATEQTRRATRGPWEEFLNSLPDTAAKADEALQAVAANGVSSLVDGLSDAIANAKNLGDVFSSVAKQIVADLIKIQLQKALAGMLGSAGGLFGGRPDYSISNVSSATSAALSGMSLPKLAGGGGIRIGGNRGVDTNLMSINGQPVAWVNRGENVRVDPNNGGGRGGIAQIVPSPYFNVVVDGRVGQGVSSAAPAMMAGGGDMALVRQQRMAGRRLA